MTEIPEGLFCKNGHKRTAKNTYVRPATARRAPGTFDCRTCKAASCAAKRREKQQRVARGSK